MRGWTTTSLILVSLWLAPRQVFAAWPPTAGNTYTVQPTEAVMSIPAMVLPAGFVLNFDPSIQRVQWNVGSLQYGKGVLIDLSHAVPIPPAPPPQAPKQA